jgi:hypothetical protein
MSTRTLTEALHDYTCGDGEACAWSSEEVLPCVEYGETGMETPALSWVVDLVASERGRQRLRQACGDPGSFVKRHFPGPDREDYEPLIQWQERALVTAIKALIEDGAA